MKGFEDYDTAEAFIDIPLKDTGAGYQIELPDKAWKNIVDCQVAVYMHTQQGRMYLGRPHRCAGRKRQPHGGPGEFLASHRRRADLL